MKRRLIIGGLVVLCLIAALIYAQRTGNSGLKSEDEGEFVNSYIKLLADNKASDSYKLLSEATKASISEEDWTKQLSQASDKYPEECDSVEIKDLESAQLTYKDMPVKRVLCSLQYDGASYIFNAVILKTDKGMVVEDTNIYSSPT